MTRSRRLLAASFLLALGCRPGGGPNEGPRGPEGNQRVVAVDSIFRTLRTVSLSLRKGELLGTPTGLVEAGASVVIADGAQANLKVFNGATGAHEATLGRPGDGPGEFRAPVALEQDRDGNLVVLDNRRNIISTRDLGGGSLREQVLLGFATGLVVPPPGDVIWVIGRLRPSSGQKRSATAEPILHRLNRRLEVEESRLPVEWPSHPWEQTFANYFGTAVGAWLAIATYRTDTFFVIRPANEAPAQGRFSAPWHLPPAWPRDSRALAGKSSIQELEAWLKKQTLLHRVTGIGADLVAGMVEVFDTAGAKDYAYIIADTAGRSRLATGPTEFLLLRSRGDTLLGVLLRPDGTAELQTRVLSRDLITPH